MGDMFQKKISEIFDDMPKLFSIADDILIVGFNEQDRDHDATLDKVLSRQAKPEALTKISVFPDAPEFPYLVK